MNIDNQKIWISNLVQCDTCTYRWVAVYVVNTKRLECPGCNNMVNYEILQ